MIGNRSTKCASTQDAARVDNVKHSRSPTNSSILLISFKTVNLGNELATGQSSNELRTYYCRPSKWYGSSSFNDDHVLFYMCLCVAADHLSCRLSITLHNYRRLYAGRIAEELGDQRPPEVAEAGGSNKRHQCPEYAQRLVDSAANMRQSVR